MTGSDIPSSTKVRGNNGIGMFGTCATTALIGVKWTGAGRKKMYLSMIFLSSPRWKPLANVYASKTHTWISCGLIICFNECYTLVLDRPANTLLSVSSKSSRVHWAVAGSSHHAVPAALTYMSPDQLAVPWVLPPTPRVICSCSGISWLISAQ